VLRRLLQGLEQAVERLGREHVHFVDDVDLAARLDRAVAHALDQLADVADAGAAGRVHLEHVDVAILGDGAAVVANAAGLRRRPALAVRAGTVERARDDPGGGGLADPAHTREHESLGHAPALDRIGQGAHRRLLADQIGEAGRAVLARQHLIGLGLGIGGLGRGGLGLGGARRADLGFRGLGVAGGGVRHRRGPVLSAAG
jgi:hypothetical protein